MRKAQVIGILLITGLLFLGACAPTPTTVTPSPAPTPTPAPTPAPAPAPAQPPPVPAPAPVPVPALAPAPAEFEVVSLSVSPLEAVAGKPVSITAVVENIGGSEGTYAAMLTMDGVLVEAKEVTITSGSSKVVTFSLVEETPGIYEIVIGDLSSTLTIEEKLVAKEFELKYDDGTIDLSQAIGGPGRGHIVQFTPPYTPFTITTVKIFGKLYGTGYENLTFDVQIWDSEQKEIHSASYPHTEFSLQPTWVEIDIPDVTVSGDFYIHVFTNSPKEGGISIYIDSSVVNEHSEVTLYWEIVDWYLSHPKEEANWMIRVVGTPAEEGTPVTSPPTSPTQTIEVSAEFQETISSLDSPQKLSQWMIENIKGESYYEREKESGTRYTPTPQETFEARSGNCRVFAIFACYILQYHGYEAEILGIKVESDERMNHVVCVYRSDGSLYVINSGRMEGPYQNYEDIASAHHEGWSSYEIHYSWESYQQLKRPDEIVYR